MEACIDFILVPDSGLARRLRRHLATAQGRKNVLVGTCNELIEYALSAYLIPAPRCLDRATLSETLAQWDDAFWSESFAIAPEDTATAIASALHEILAASPPREALKAPSGKGLSPRAKRHLDDLFRLASALAPLLPEPLASIRALLDASRTRPLRHIRVHTDEGLMPLSPWQHALVDRLNQDAPVTTVQTFSQALRSMASPAETANQESALGILQRHLFSPSKAVCPVDGSIQFVGVRDCLQEAEVVAGMVQSLLAGDSALRPADIAVLIPDSFDYALALSNAFQVTGLPLSGLPLEIWRRDLGREALFHFLYAVQKPAPAMALAVLLASPLMPWSREHGGVLAQQVMGGEFRLCPLEGMDKSSINLLYLLGQVVEEPKALGGAISTFVNALRADESHQAHILLARETAARLHAALDGMRSIDWPQLRRLSLPSLLTEEDQPEFLLEGISVWREGKEPWRPARHTFVLGFSEGHYPTKPSRSPVFSADEWEAIRTRTHLAITTPSDRLGRDRARFKRQLQATSDSLTFLVPHLSYAGDSLNPSESLVFIQQFFPEGAKPILEVDIATDRSEIRHLAVAAPAEPLPPRPLVAKDLDFGRDLLALRKKADGTQKPESPSGLETLMVSSLAWLLRRLDAEPQGWAPERPDVLTLGSIAHRVFELLFPADTAIADAGTLEAQLDAALDDAISRHAPYMKRVQWRAERLNLATELKRAALAWQRVLTDLDASILGSEIWLEGQLDQTPIHGQADQILKLNGGGLLVVDYKRSSSSGRVARMQAGFDAQASLYRTMLATGGPKTTDAATQPLKLKASKKVGVLYFMLNDQTPLSDACFVDASHIPRWQTIQNDISSEAIKLIRQRLREVKAGQIRLNRTQDETFFSKTAGLTPYALENSPLIRLFMIEDRVEVTP
ncbi:MAG: PD-(D/E)XK nuclease family protein [Gammaproteobacteria bacterium SHHR-1]